MDIYSPKGSKVVFLNKNGHGWQRDDAVTAGLVEGEAYTVESIDVDSWVSYVTLEEFPDNAFNTVMFENVEEQATNEVVSDTKIKAGDTVYHKPCDERWYVLGVNYATGRLCVAGWPPSIADIADCTLVEKGTGIEPNELEYRNKAFGGGWE